MRRKLLLVLLSNIISLIPFLAMALVSYAQGPCNVKAYTLMVDGNGVQLDTTVRIPTVACPPLDNNRRPMIISLHGVGGDKSDVDDLAVANAKLGNVAVNFTWRGHPTSTGEFSWTVILA